MKLLKHLNENDGAPIILFSSTNYTCDVLLIIYVKSIEIIYNQEKKISQEIRVLYFYKLIKLTDVSEDADTYMKYLKRTIGSMKKEKICLK